MWDYYSEIKSKIRTKARAEGQYSSDDKLFYESHPDLLQETWEAEIVLQDGSKIHETINVHSLIHVVATSRSGAGVVTIHDMSEMNKVFESKFKDELGVSDLAAWGGENRIPTKKVQEPV